MGDEGGNKRHRTGSISGRLRTASDLEQCGLIDSNQKGVLKDMIISGDSTLQGALEKYELGDYSELEAIIKSGTLADRRSSIDLLDGLDLDFLGNSFGDSFDGFEFDGTTNPFDNVGGGGGDKFRYSDSEQDQDLLEARHSLTGERISMTSITGERISMSSMDSNPTDQAQVHIKEEPTGGTGSSTNQRGGSAPTQPNNTNTSASVTSQGSGSSSTHAASVGYDPLFSSGITYEEQRLRAGSFHTEQQQMQQRARANSLMMDPNYNPQQMHSGSRDAWQNPSRNPGYYQGGAGAFPTGFPDSGMGLDMYGGADMYGMGNTSFGMGGGGHGGVGSFGASPDIDYGMGIYEQRLRGQSFQQVNNGRMRAGSFQLYPSPQQQQQMAAMHQQQQQQQQQSVLRGAVAGGGSMMPPTNMRSGYPSTNAHTGPMPSSHIGSSGSAGVHPGEKRMMHQMDSKPHPHHPHQHLSHSSQSMQQPHPQSQQHPHPHNMYLSGASQQPYHPATSDPSQAQALAAQGYVGTYSPEARKERIQRFLDKRKSRVWTKKVKYDVRKNFADSRIRVKGRFVKKEDEEKMRLQLGEEEWARVVAKSRGEAC